MMRETKIQIGNFGSYALSLLSVLESYVTRYPIVFLCFGLLIFLGRVLVQSRLKRFWIDEIFTWAQAQSPNLSALWSGVVHAPASLDPPLYPIVAFFALRLPLHPDLSLRLPSFVFYAAMMLSLYVIMRRRAPESVALIACFIPMVAPVSNYALEARPYALLLALCGWAFALWQRAADRRSGRATSLVLLFLCLTGAIWTHYLALLLFVPLYAGELWRTAVSGFDRGVWFTMLLPVAAVLVYIPLLPAASAYLPFTWVETTGVLGTYAYAFAPGIFVLLLLCCLADLALPATNSNPLALTGDNRGIQFRDYEYIAIATLFLLPVLVFGVANFLTHNYQPRHALPFSVAAALLISAAFAVLAHRIRGLLSLVLVLILLSPAIPLVRAFVRGLPASVNSIDRSSIEVIDRFPDLPLAVPDFEYYVRFRLFGPNRIEKRMVLVSVSPGELRDVALDDKQPPLAAQGLQWFALANIALHRFIGAPVKDFGSFIDAHSHFLLIDTSPQWDGTVAREAVLRKGRLLRWLGMSDSHDVYLAESSAGGQ